ncbi:hypothetical protein GCM10008955_17990 [Deinococcus malanensis]|uniref:DUF3809 domain-containing protein n=1 Tax=Deinococcus malanensis TaxID=1706855 RepID=A0ABQ2ESY5_9DEIO|nr:DUF3809 domain-containing protein [Deinococcus malanensis]GGK24786.1 hypothetical protein GCM10008955_17990 [Deinococcus malanensis]
MILDARQSFVLTHPGSHAQALAFVRDPAVALSQVRFLRGLQADGYGVRGELVVTVPILGEVDLPFVSRLQLTSEGAELVPELLAGERAWVEVSGQARAKESAEVHFDFQFSAHLAVPEAEGWGGAAFEKMVGAAASRTLERVARELPGSVARAMSAG